MTPSDYRDLLTFDYRDLMVLCNDAFFRGMWQHTDSHELFNGLDVIDADQMYFMGWQL